MSRRTRHARLTFHSSFPPWKPFAPVGASVTLPHDIMAMYAREGMLCGSTSKARSNLKEDRPSYTTPKKRGLSM